MESLYLLIPLSLVVLAIAVAIFFWAVNSGQYDDIDREGERILFDEDGQPQSTQTAADDDAQGEGRGD